MKCRAGHHTGPFTEIEPEAKFRPRLWACLRCGTVLLAPSEIANLARKMAEIQC